MIQSVFRQARGSRLFSSDNPCVNFFKFFFYPFPLAQSSIFPLVACTFFALKHFLKYSHIWPHPN